MEDRGMNSKDHRKNKKLCLVEKSKNVNPKHPLLKHPRRPVALEEYLDKRDQGFYVSMESDAMQEIGIRKNDLVVANANHPLENGSIIVAVMNGETLVRQYFKNDHGEYLSPSNVAYPTIEINENNCNICGVVTKIIHTLY